MRIKISSNSKLTLLIKTYMCIKEGCIFISLVCEYVCPQKLDNHHFFLTNSNIIDSCPGYCDKCMYVRYVIEYAIKHIFRTGRTPHISFKTLHGHFQYIHF